MGDENDLPLLSNISDIRARHYIINFQTDVNSRVIHGKVFIFFEPTTVCEKNGKCCTRDCFCSCIDQSNISEENSVTWKSSDLNSSEYDGNQETRCESEKQSGAESNSKNSVEVNCPKSVEIPETVLHEVKDEDFVVTLDCCNIKVKNISEVLYNNKDVKLNQYLHPHLTRKCPMAFNFWSGLKQQTLNFSVSTWCLKIWKNRVKHVKEFPQVICIEYETTQEGISLLWNRDQDDNPCVYTAAAAINNRSLMPCQDPPSAMATWQAWITVPQNYYVSMTGDRRPLIFSGSVDRSDRGLSSEIHSPLNCSTVHEVPQESELMQKNTLSLCYYYHTTMVLPIATIAIAIGQWRTQILPSISAKTSEKGRKDATVTHKYPCSHYEYPCHVRSDLWEEETQLSVVFPASRGHSVKSLISFLPYAVEAAVACLGVYPCPRVEIVLLPTSFGSLGLASPNVIFLSPTVVIEDSAAHIRLAHEISHAWFGINIGAQDWTEEWLSEGFATYMEDSIYARAIMSYQEDLGMPVGSSCRNEAVEYNSSQPSQAFGCGIRLRQDLEELSELRAHLRYRTLSSELEHSSEELQTLRPTQGESLVNEDGIRYVKHGLNPEKTFLQVHYLKGYFLLRYLSMLVGRSNLDAMLSGYVTRFHGQLVQSEHVLDLFTQTFPHMTDSGVSKALLYKEWLNHPGLNNEMKRMYDCVSNSLVDAVEQHYQYCLIINKNTKGQIAKKPRVNLTHFQFSDQLVLLLEYLLELPKLTHKLLRHVQNYYGIGTQNGDVRHRWCELVIKHRFPDLTEVERFLVDDQSMGVYLYGELVISRKPKLKSLAEKIFLQSRDKMDENARKTVSAMIYGN